MSGALLAMIPFLRGFGFVFAPTINADTANYNLKAAAIAAGWDQVAPLIATVTMNSGVVVYATSTGGYAFDTGATFPAGTVLTLICPGFICGMGGAGGAYNGNGSNGGAALRAQYALAVDNSGGVIAGGGGGASGGSGGGGGGGRGGRTNSTGGAKSGSGLSAVGSGGTFTSGGAGGAGDFGSGGGAGGTTAAGSDGSSPGAGGGGGGWGASGGRGKDSLNALRGTAGNGGAAVVGSSYITWINTGTRYGAIS